MKKALLVLLPIAAMGLVGCRGRGGRTPTSVTPTTGTPTSVTPTTGTTVAPTTQTPTTGTPTTGTPTTTSPQPVPTGWDTTPGSHEKVIDFVKDFATYKEGFPYISADTGITDASLDGLSLKDRGCFVGSYNGSGYLMMKNKEMDGNPAFIASQYSLGKITEITFTTGSSASTNAVYNVLISDTAQQDSSTAGTSFTGTGGTVTGSGKYFCISCTSVGSKSYNGQLGTLTVKYTIS